MLQPVGICSVCGGDVMGYRGAWWSVLPPPPDTCGACGARRAEAVIPMVPTGQPQQRWRIVTTNTTTPLE